MIIIGEKLNSSIPSSLEAMKACAGGDPAALTALARRQLEAGADYLDINAALIREEAAAFNSVLDAVLPVIGDAGLVVDTPNVDVARQLAPRLAGIRCIYNSVTLDDREGLIGIAAETGASVVAMPSSSRGISPTLEGRVADASALIDRIAAAGIPHSRIYVDCMVEALSVGDDNPAKTLGLIRECRRLYPDCKTVCGLSNVSFGLPLRKHINAAFLAMAVFCGLDAAILDITSESVRAALYAANALCGQDEYCIEYIGVARELMGDR